MHAQRILIVGGGFAAVNAAVGAVEVLGATQNRIAVELISPDPFWVIKPRLYEPDLTGVRVPLDDVLNPLGVVHHQSTVTSIDTAQRWVTLRDGSPIRYDQLVLAAGSQIALPDGPNVYCVDSYAQAVELRRAVDELGRRHGRFRAVVVGAGFTGLELATELARHAEVTLVAAPELAPAFGPRARTLIEQALRSLGVRVRAGAGVTEITEGAVTLADGERICTDFVAWTAGPRANKLTEEIPAKRDALGRLLVDPYLLTGAPAVWAAGDTACAKVDATNNSVMSCQHAAPQGRRAGENAARVMLDRSPRRYRQPVYNTCLALGDFGGLVTYGYDRDTVLVVGQEAGKMKRAINHRLIYPPEGEGRRAMLKIGKPAPPGPLAGALTRQALRSRRLRAKLVRSPERSTAYATVDSFASG